jgi:(5-formylfuran-3-yl)methyl phosphate synthase
MTRLLISVRDAAEAEIALAGGADLIDVKEPARGPLGAADAATIRAIVAHVAGRASLSAALGELNAENRLEESLSGHVRYAKYGLAGCGRMSDWTIRFRAAVALLPPGVTPVGVAYADWKAAGAPELREVLARASSLGCGAVLLDTFDKNNGPLGRHVSRVSLQRFIASARASGLACVVAGGLGRKEIAEILPLAPDYVGVRGAACTGGRTGRLDARRVAQIANLVHGRACIGK